MKVKDTVRDSNGQVGIVEALETELGKDYASVRFSAVGFCHQVLKSTLTVINKS